jgi:AraC-like DNA-binding protein
MVIYIKNMVSLRCKMIVKEALKNLNLNYNTVDLGVVVMKEPIKPHHLDELKKELDCYGLEILEDKKAILVEKIKNIIIKMIHYEDEQPKVNFSYYLSEQLKYDYTYLSNVFSELKGITIQQYIIVNKIERVKELILYNELNLSQISQKLHYSSVAHLSNQFKKVTGFSPSVYRERKQVRDTTLESI